MKVCIFGAGYVGLVTAACLADMGNSVVCIDVDAARVDALQRGEIPIHEPGLAELVLRNAAAGRLLFTTDAAAAVAHGTIVFIAVGTPSAEDGSADLGHVLAAAAVIGRHMLDYKVVVNLYDPALLASLGFEHIGIGRAVAPPRSTCAAQRLQALAA